MPREGYKSITVPDAVYDYLMDDWRKHKEEYRLKYGITSFSGYCTKKLALQIQEEKAKLAGKSQRSHS